jgi:uncharacterized membrane protein YcgQ (UPF0703/DUF1980 family)
VISGPDGQPYLARLIVSCCAADARPVKVGLSGNLPAGVPSGPATEQWLEVDGSYIERVDRDPINQDLIPYVHVEAVRLIAAPARQYES